MKIRFTRRTQAVAIGVTLLGALAACTSTPSDSAQVAAQNTTEKIEQAAAGAVPFPLPQIKAEGWTERKELAEHAIRENDPHAVRYAALIAAPDVVVETWQIEGTVFTPNSQLTNTQSQNYGYSGANGGSFYDGVVDAPGDNGTWGPEAMCYDFFTTSGGEVQLGCNSALEFQLSDRPFTIKQQPTLSINENAPSGVKDEGQLKGINH